ncbi:acetyl-CoA synthetase-like protein [Hortaea werneckii]|nr:acetyl-CoA synthetase-like protein [Hortaea werneckii]KAI7625780.1 acetyl-CoA synthetase-like protein [Hortaea werneckii]KAI7717319.1 acetyl-CoA synthetase-like protein [Hortaea werneckii]
MAALVSQLAGKPVAHEAESMCDLLSSTARRHSDRTALVSMHQHPDASSPLAHDERPLSYIRWTYTDLHDRAQLLAASFRKRGLRKADRIAVFLPNSAEWAIAFWAAMLSGFCLVLIQPRAATNATELCHLMKLSKAKAVLAWDVELVEELQAAAPRALRTVPIKVVCRLTSVVREGWTVLRDLLRESTDYSASDLDNGFPTVGPSDPAIILFTSGTTGLSKGCVHTHKTLTTMACNHAENLGIDENAVSASHLSLAHCFGMLYSVAFWSVGGQVVYPNALFDAASTLEAIQLEACTNMPAVPSLLHSLADGLGSSKLEHTSLRHIELSGAIATSDVFQMARETFGPLKLSIHYGLTESGPVVAWPCEQVPEYCEDGKVTSGFPVAGCIVRVCAPQSRTPLPRGEVGEIHQNSSQLVTGYMGIAQDDSFYEDENGNWYVTGDQGIMHPSGEVEVCGRYKDIIIRGGENISPAQIEAVISSDNRLEACVVGASDDILGEVPVAVVSGGDRMKDFGQSLPSLVVQHLGPSFALDQVVTLSDLGLVEFPRTTSGKIRKQELALALDKYRKASKPRPTGNGASLSRADSFDIADPLEKVLTDVWSRILGVPERTLGPDTKISDLADSLTMMQFRRLLRKDHALELSLSEMIKNPTIAEQAILLGKTEKDTPTKMVSASGREGPPGPFDVVEAYGDRERLQSIQQLVTPLLGLYGLGWAQDVEDIIPMNDVLANMVTARRRLRSSLRRDAFYCPNTTVGTLYTALQDALSAHPLLRSMWVPTSASSVSHLIVRPSERCWKLFLDSTGHCVDSPEDLAHVWYGDNKLDSCGGQRGPGPLFRAVVFSITGEPSSAGVVYWTNHSAFDATSLSFFHETLNDLFPYAQAGARYFGEKLMGFAGYQASMVPQQRAPGFLEGSDEGWMEGNSAPGMRVPIDGQNGRLAANKGLRHVFKYSGLARLHREHSIAAHVVFKAALAVVNTDWTCTRTAFFRSLESGRQWPFLDSALASHLPSAEDIDGPTLQASFNVINFKQEAEATIDLLKRLRDDQESATRYQCTPLSLALAQLSEADRTALLDCGLSQLFNWVPNRSHLELTELCQVQDEMNADTGLHWDFTSRGLGEVEAFVRWDCCQLGQGDVKQMLEDLEKVVDWLSDPMHWHVPTDERPKESKYRVWRPAVDELQLAAMSLMMSGT